MGAIIGLLAEYNGREVSEWHLSMNLSTLVALLSTVIRANIVMMVSSVISQLKWSWFTARPQPLRHLQDFDSGSRTGVGSLRLVWMLLRRGRTALALAACALPAAAVVALSFVVGPFMQQAIKTEICPRFLPNVNSSIPVSSYYQGQWYRIAAGMWEINVDMKGSMIQGLTNPRSHDLAVQAFCPTGNCSFPDYGTGVTHASLGMCSSCNDRTAEVSGPDDKGNITLRMSRRYGSDPWITLKSGQPYLSVVSDTGAMTDVTILSASNSPCTNTTHGFACPHRNTTESKEGFYGGIGDFIAATCTLYPCIKAYSGSVREGKLLEDIAATTEVRADLFNTSNLGNYTALRSPCILDHTGTWYTEANVSLAPKVPGRTWDWVVVDDKNITAPNACLYKLNAVYARALAAFMTDVFDGTCTYDTRQGDDLWCRDRWWLSPLYNQGNSSFPSIAKAMDDFANAITTKFRTAGWGPDEHWVYGQWHGAGGGVEGAVLQNSICTSLDWRWLLLPCGLLAISAVLLAWVIARSFDRGTGEPLWKSNVLPLVLYGLGTGAWAEKMGRYDTGLSGIEAAAEEMTVRYVVREDGRPGFVSATAAEIGTPVRRYSIDSLLIDRTAV